MDKIKKTIKHFFRPDERNNYRAKSLHTNILSLYLLIILGLAIIFSIGQNVLGIATDITISRLIELTNEKRTEQGLPPLVYNEQLADAARRKASDMISKRYWAHFGPNNESPWAFILASGYRYETAGENLAKDFCCSSDVVSAWMLSPLHRENIVRKSYKDIGFAVVNGNLTGDDTTLVVQLFGSRKTENSVAQAIPQVEASENKNAVAKVPTQSPSPTTEIISVTPQVFATGKTIGPPKSTSPALKVYQVAKESVSNISFIAIVVLALALLCDLYYAYKLDVIRMTGKNIAHLTFVSVFLIGFFIVAKGVIL